MSKKLKKKQTELIIIFLLIIGCVLIYLAIFSSAKTKNAKVIAKIPNYGYTLDDRDTKLMENTFNELHDELSKGEINEEKYAELIAKLFVIDVYTINNKIDMYDVGGLEYIHPDKYNEFKAKMRDTLYLNLANENNRDNDMPEVKSVTLKDIEKSNYKYQNEDFHAYEVTLNWDYVKDLGYDTKASIMLVKMQKKLYVASFTPEVTK